MFKKYLLKYFLYIFRDLSLKILNYIIKIDNKIKNKIYLKEYLIFIDLIENKSFNFFKY